MAPCAWLGVPVSLPLLNPLCCLAALVAGVIPTAAPLSSPGFGRKRAGGVSQLDMPALDTWLQPVHTVRGFKRWVDHL